MRTRIGALAGLILIALTGCANLGEPTWQVGSSAGCRQTFGTRSSTSATRPDVVLFCAESP